MKRRRTVVLLAAAACLMTMGERGMAAVAGEAQVSQEKPSHRVVFHVNTGDERAQKGVLNNIKNLSEAVGADRIAIELVAHGPGLSLLIKRETKFGSELARLRAGSGVHFIACSNTMKALGLTGEDLVEQVDRTMPAMVRLMELQEQGWAYIKP